MFPHHKLDWNLGRLERRLEEKPDDTGARTEYAVAALSRALFHEGGEVWYNRALTHARRALQADPANASALVVGGISLARLDRAEPAQRYLDEALIADPDRADVHLGLALLHQMAHDPPRAIREMEMACRLAPSAWEPNFLLARMLWDRAQDAGTPDPARSKRLLERSQFHAVRALSHGASASAEPPLLYQVAITCLHLGRYNEATRLFQRLLDHERYRVRAQYYLGLAFYQLGKYKNSVLYLRQHLDSAPRGPGGAAGQTADSPKVHARLGMCYLQLGEITKARESCNRALAADPGDVQARWTLGCALLEEGRTDEAIKTFKSILEEAPDHAPAFAELVRIRTAARDVTWLRQALRAEVAGHDRLPAAARRTAAEPEASPRTTTQDRIAVIVDALHPIDPNAVSTLLDAMDLTTDENLRFILWESAVDAVAAQRGREVARQLEAERLSWSAAAGREVLSVAPLLTEALLTRGLQIGEEDLRRSAVAAGSRDVSDLRLAVDRQRQDARAWQTCLLLAIASRQSLTGRALLTRWAAEADADLATAAHTALVVHGEASSVAELRKITRRNGQEHHVDILVNQVQKPAARFQPRPVSSGTDLVCSTCGKRAEDVDHLLAPEPNGPRRNAVCDQCMAAIAQDRKQLRSEDVEIRCALCNRDAFESRAVYTFRAVPVCADCLDTSLGLLEREEVERYLSAF